MKKTASILLLFLLMFNWVGYRFLIHYADIRFDRSLEADLDAGNFNENELIELKVPFSIPYQSGSNKFERFSGEIEIEGIIYKYVKRKFHNDSLTLLCIPNHDKMMIKDAKSKYFELVNALDSKDQSNPSQKKQVNILKSLLSDYTSNRESFEFLKTLPASFKYYDHSALQLKSPLVRMPERPPSA